MFIELIFFLIIIIIMYFTDFRVYCCDVGSFGRFEDPMQKRLSRLV